MAISRTRKARKTPPDLRYYPYFPTAYREFIKTVPSEFRIHIKKEVDGGSDVTGDGSFDKPFANVEYAVNYVVNKRAAAPWTKWGFIIYPGTYTARGTVNPSRKKHPDYRVTLFTDTFDNPIPKLPENQRYTITTTTTTDKKGKVTTKTTKTDNYATHAFKSTTQWTYNFQFIGAGGNTRIEYQTYPYYFDPNTKKFWNINEAVAGNDKLAYLGIYPKFYNTANRANIQGGFSITEQFFSNVAVPFTVVEDGNYTFRYYTERKPDNALYRISTHYGNTQQRGLFFDERHAWYYVNTTNTNPTGNADLYEIGNIYLNGTSSISYGTGKFDNCLSILGGGFYVPYEANSVLDFGTSDFTIELYVKLGNGSVYGPLFSNFQEMTGIYSYDAKISSDAIEVKLYHNNSKRSSNTTVLKSRRLTKNIWYHIVFARTGTTAYLFINGTLVDSKTTNLIAGKISTPVVYSFPKNRPGTFYVGAGQSSTDRAFLYRKAGNLFVDEVRVSNVFRYTPANITVPVNTFVNDLNTVTLLSLDKNLSDNNIPDIRADTVQVLAKGATLLTPYAFNSESGNVANSLMTRKEAWLRVDYNPRLNLNNTFTIDFWALIPSSISGTTPIVAKDHQVTGKKAFAIESVSSGMRFRLSFDGLNWGFDHLLEDRSYFDTFNHFSISKQGTTVRIFKNGKLESIVNTSNQPLYASNSNVYIGALNDAGISYSVPIIVNNLRIADNVYVSSNFSIPETDYSASEYADTVLLIGQNGNILTDASTVNNSITNRSKNQGIVSNGANVVGVPVSPFLNATTGYSAYWPGSLDTHVHFLPTADIDVLASGTWTIEGFFKYEKYPASKYVTLVTNSSNRTIGRNQFSLFVEYSSLRLKIVRDSITPEQVKETGWARAIPSEIYCGTVDVNGWNHFAMVNDSGNLRVFLNGVQNIANIVAGYGTGLTSKSGPINMVTSQGLVIGQGKYYQRLNYTAKINQFNGYIHGLRISDDVKYNTNFSVPAVPFSPSVSDKLLSLNEDNWRTKSTFISIYGDVLDAKNSPFAASDLNGSHLFVDTELVSADKKTEIVALGLDDFTVEGYYYKYGQSWVDKESFFTLRGISLSGLKFLGSVLSVYVSIINKPGEQGYYIVVPNGSFRDKTSSNFIEYYKYTALPATNKWVHVALVRKEGAMTLFVDGVAVWNQIDQNFNFVKGYVVVGGRESSVKFTGLVSNFRISKSARYNSAVSIPSEPFVSNISVDPYFNNVGVLAHFETENYKRRPSTKPKNTPDDNFGHSNNIFLNANVTHTLYTSAYNFNYQGVFGFDVSDKNNIVIFESRNLPRDHNLGLMQHPESSVRGIHIRYDSAKAFYYQHSLFNSHSIGPGPKTWISPKRTKGGKYDPLGPGASGMFPAMVTKKIKDPVTKTVATVTEQGLKSMDLKSQLYGKYINLGIEGVELNLRSAGGGGPMLMDRCTFRFPNVSSFPTYNINVTGVSDIGPSSNQSNLYIKHSVFGGPDANSLPRVKFRSNYIAFGDKWWTKPIWPKFGYGPALNQRVPVMSRTFFGANIAANTMSILSSPIPPGQNVVDLTFKVGRSPSQRYVNAPGVSRPLIPALLKGATTSDFRNSTANVSLHGTTGLGFGSLYFKPTADNLTPTQELGLLTGYPYVVTNSAIENNVNNWKISLYLYHLGNFAGTLRYETIFISGRYFPPDRSRINGDLAPGSWQLSAKSLGSAVNKFQLELYRKGTPQTGERASLGLTGGNFNINTWYKVDVIYNYNVVSLLVNNMLVKEKEYGDDIIKFPDYDYKYNNQYLFYLGKPPLYRQFFSPLRTRSWTGYIQYVKTYSGEDLTNSDIGVYSGTYKWVL